MKTRLVLGAALVRAKRYTEAERLYAAGLALSPRHADLLQQHGESLLDLGRLEKAIERFRAVLEVRSGDPDALASLGGALLRVDRPAEAADVLRAAAAALPGDPIVHELWGDALAQCGRVPEARDAYHAAWQLGRRTRAIAFFCGNAFSDSGHFSLATQMFDAGRALPGDEPVPWHNLGKARFELGDVAAASAAFRESSARGEATSLRNLAVTVPGDPRADHAEVRRVRAEYARRIALECAPWTPPPRTTDRLRIGYVSSFFAKANYMRPVYAVLAAHDPDVVDVELFRDGPASDTLDGAVANSAVRAVTDVSATSNVDLVGLIRSRALDVLIDLNAYSAMGRLPIYTARLARCGIGWFNHYATAALPGLDVLIGDSQTVAAGEAEFYAERIESLPLSYLAFGGGHLAPDVVPPPCLLRGHLTFGSLCSQYKITPDVLAAWGRALTGVPDSRLLLANRTLAAPDVAEYVRESLARHGVAGDRVELRVGAPHQEYLRNYDDIDIALDAWPYNGGTTTTEAIWQGVPVLTFRGDRWASRTSASLLVDGPFDIFLRDSEEEMVAFAVELGSCDTTPQMLAGLRASARDRLLASPVCDTVRLARELERIYSSVAGARAVS